MSLMGRSHVSILAVTWRCRWFECKKRWRVAHAAISQSSSTSKGRSEHRDRVCPLSNGSSLLGYISCSRTAIGPPRPRRRVAHRSGQRGPACATTQLRLRARRGRHGRLRGRRGLQRAIRPGPPAHRRGAGGRRGRRRVAPGGSPEGLTRGHRGDGPRAADSRQAGQDAQVGLPAGGWNSPRRRAMASRVSQVQPRVMVVRWSAPPKSTSASAWLKARLVSTKVTAKPTPVTAE